MRERLLDAACLLVLAALPWLLFRGVLALWWADDDLNLLGFLRSHARGDYLWSPAPWLSLPGRGMTPLQFLSLHFDLVLFGMEPRPFYVHQLLVLGGAAIAVFAALRRWWGRALALGGAVLFLLGRPVVTLAPMLSARHWAEAILCGALAIVFFDRAVRTASRPSAFASALLALAAMGFKETAVPLPFFLAALPLGERRERLRALAPQAGACLLYGVYRLYMLGADALQGYGFKLLPTELPRHLLALPGRACLLFVEPGVWGTAGLALLAAGLGTLALLRAGSLLRVALASGLALAPIVPVSLDLAERYVLALWLVAIVSVVAGLTALAQVGGGWRALAVALGLMTLIVFLGVEHQAWSRVRARATRSDAESRALLRLGDGDVLRQPVARPGFLDELYRYRVELLGVPGNPGWFKDDLALCLDRFPKRRLWQFDPSRAEVVERSAELGEIRRSACGSIRWDAPLRALFVFHEHDLEWSLDGGSGAYALVFDDGVGRIEVPPRAAFHQQRPRPLRLRVRYASPDGWITFSDDIVLRGVPGERVEWHRP